ncbi:MAG: type 4a pilus biogenesis protein PilO [Rhodothermales bacterium]
MNTLRNRPWLAGAIVGVTVALGLIVFGVAPHLYQTLKLYREAEALDARIREAADWDAEASRMDAERMRLAEDTDTRLVALPTLEEEAILLRFVEQTAASTGVRITRWRPAGVRRLETYAEREISLTASGRFHEIGRFVDGIERAHLLIRVVSGSIQRTPASSGELRLALILVVAFASGERGTG